MCPFKQAIRIITSKDSFWHKERDTQWKIILSLLWLIKSYFMFHALYKEMTVFLFPFIHSIHSVPFPCSFFLSFLTTCKLYALLLLLLLLMMLMFCVYHTSSCIQHIVKYTKIQKKTVGKVTRKKN